MAVKGVASKVNETMEEAEANPPPTGDNLLEKPTYRGITRETFTDEAGVTRMRPEVVDKDGNVHHIG